MPSISRLNRLLEERSPAFILGLGIVTMGGIAIADYYTGITVGFALFYLIPVIMVTWFVNRWWGVAFSMLSALSLDIAEYLGGRRVPIPNRTWNAVMYLLIFLLVVLLIARLRIALDRESALARTDTLTGSFNSLHFYELAETELARARRYSHPLSLAYLDLDNFKQVNDRYGHETGDEALRVTAATARAHLRGTDMLARLGGDEFAVLLPETGPEQAAAVVQRLRHDTLEAMRERRWPVTLSIGLVTFASPPESVEELIKEADALMYEVKNGGKDDVRQIVV